MRSLQICGDSSDTQLLPALECPTSREGSRRRAPRILVVDDEALIANTIVQILNRNGFVAEPAYNGKQAIEIAKLSCPDLVLSDVLMPGVDGVEAAIAIREACPDTRIVLFSGQAATVEILTRARERGHVFELLPKPIHPTELLKRLRE